MKTKLRIPSFLIVLFLFGCNQFLDTSGNNSAKRILPPLPHANIADMIFHIDAKKGGILQYKTGTLINIPPEAFIDKYGNPIKDTVEIAYREMHSLSEIFVSGIPMTYDSSGTEYYFESAGMNEIIAYKNNEPIFINKNKAIDINMKSSTADSKFNLYYFDTIQNKWINKGKDMTVTVDESEIDKPVEPVLADKDKQIFTINVDYAEFPELKVFENTVFQLTDSQKIEDKYTDKLYYDVMIEKGKSKGTYKISFDGYDNIVEFEVTPIYDEKDITKAIATYDDKFGVYKQLLLDEIEKEKLLASKRRIQERQEMKALMEKYNKEDDAEKKSVLQQQINNLKADSIDAANQNQLQIQPAVISMYSTNPVVDAIYRTFRIRQFGYYNCDCPLTLPRGAEVAASFTSEDGTPLQFSTVTLIQPSKKMTFAYYSTGFSHFRFDPLEVNMLCAVTADGKFAYYTSEDFKDVKKSGNYTFKMRISPEAIKSSDDIDELLALK